MLKLPKLRFYHCVNASRGKSLRNLRYIHGQGDVPRLKKWQKIDHSDDNILRPILCQQGTLHFCDQFQLDYWAIGSTDRVIFEVEVKDPITFSSNKYGTFERRYIRRVGCIRTAVSRYLDYMISDLEALFFRQNSVGWGKILTLEQKKVVRSHTNVSSKFLQVLYKNHKKVIPLYEAGLFNHYCGYPKNQPRPYTCYFSHSRNIFQLTFSMTIAECLDKQFFS